jgi:hypothetical protein
MDVRLGALERCLDKLTARLDDGMEKYMYVCVGVCVYIYSVCVYVYIYIYIYMMA